MQARRMGAAVLDLLVLGVAGLTLGAVVSRSGPHDVFVAFGLAVAVFVLVDAALHARGGSRAGQGLGKQLFRLRVVSARAERFGAGRWVARSILRWVGAAMCGTVRDGRSAHDRILGTEVVDSGDHQA